MKMTLQYFVQIVAGMNRSNKYYLPSLEKNLTHYFTAKIFNYVFICLYFSITYWNMLITWKDAQSIIKIPTDCRRFVWQPLCTVYYGVLLCHMGCKRFCISSRSIYFILIQVQKYINRLRMRRIFYEICRIRMLSNQVGRVQKLIWNDILNKISNLSAIKVGLYYYRYSTFSLPSFIPLNQ